MGLPPNRVTDDHDLVLKPFVTGGSPMKGIPHDTRDRIDPHIFSNPPFLHPWSWYPPNPFVGMGWRGRWLCITPVCGVFMVSRCPPPSCVGAGRGLHMVNVRLFRHGYIEFPEGQTITMLFHDFPIRNHDRRGKSPTN